jgi:ankyrin repeat protein
MTTGNTSLHLAVIDEKINCHILEETILYGECSDINAKNNNGETPLFCAFKSYQYDKAKILAKYGADFTIQNNKGDTVLSISKGSMFADVIIFNYFKQ